MLATALVAGGVAGFALRGLIGFREFRVQECNGQPIRIAHPLGWSPHALDLFVAGYVTQGPLSLELGVPGSSHSSDRVVLQPRSPNGEIEFSRLGDWYSEAELRFTAKQCHLFVLYRFRALP